MRNLLLNQRSARFTVWQMIAFGIVCALIGMVVSSYASLDKTQQGLINTPSYNSTNIGVLTDYWEEQTDGQWTADCGSSSPVNGFYPCVQLHGTGEINYNTDLITLPNAYILQFWYSNSNGPTTTTYPLEIRFRWQDSNNYYRVRIPWNSQAAQDDITIDKVVNGTPSTLGTYTDFGPNVNYVFQFKLIVTGTSTTSIKLYVRGIDITTGKEDIREFWNDSNFTVFPSPHISVTDSTSPFTNGGLRLWGDSATPYIAVASLRISSASGISVSGLSTNQYALLCQSPEIRQGYVGAVSSTYTFRLTDNDDGTYAAKNGQEFQFLENVTLDTVTYFLRKVGTPTGNIVVKIYNDSAGQPGTVVATSDAIDASTIGNNTSPFNYPDEVTFTFTSPPSLTANTDYYAIVEGTTYSTDTSNYLLGWLTTSNSVIYGLRWRMVSGTSSWVSDAAIDMAVVIRSKEVLRVSALESSGIATIDASNLWMPFNGTIKIATSNTNCSTGIVDSTPTSMIHAGGDAWTYYVNRKLTLGPRLGCPDDNEDFPIWFRGSDYHGGTQAVKICYDTLTSDVTESNCEAGCTGGVCILTSATNVTNTTDYTGVITLSGLSNNTSYTYAVIIDDQWQEQSKFTFITPPSASTEVDYNFCASSCFNINQMPFDHIDNIISEGCKIYWSLGDNIYTDVPWDLKSDITKQDYWERHRDTLYDISYKNIYSNTYQCQIFDDHEWKNDGYGNSGTQEAPTENVISQYYKASLSGVDNYVSNLKTSSSVIRSGEYYYKARWGRSVFLIFDEIYEKDIASDTDTSTEQNNLTTCSATDGSTSITCTGETFSGFNYNEAIIIFDNRMYSVINATGDTLTVGETVRCNHTGGDCTPSDVDIWKSGKEMVSRQQMIDISLQLYCFDNGSAPVTCSTSHDNTDAIIVITSKALNAYRGANIDGWGESYTKQRDWLLNYVDDHITTEPIFISGDAHKYAIYSHDSDTMSYINSSTGIDEFLVGNGGAPNDIDIQTNSATDIVEEFILRKAMGVVNVDTTTVTDDDPHAGITFSIKDVNGNIVYNDIGNVKEVATRKSVHTVLNYQHTYKIQRGTDGYCYALYYNGTAFKLAVSDVNCQNFSDNALDVSALSFDNDGQSPSMWWNDDGTTKKLIFYYVKSAKTQAYMRTATLTAGSPTWNSDETSWFGNDTGNYATNLQVVTDSSNYVWGVATVWLSGTQDGVRLKRATCGTNCVTTISGNALTDAVTANIDMMNIIPITNSDVVIIWEESTDIYYAECDQTTPSCAPGRTLLNSINTSGENATNSALGGWQPQMAHDGSGGVGILYRSSTYPYSAQFRKYDSVANSWGSAITIGNANNKNQTSPTIAKVGTQFVIGWLEGTLKTLKLYRSILNPTVVGDFVSLNINPDDGWIKTKLSLSQPQTGSPAILYWQRVFGINKDGYGQPIEYSQPIIIGTINPYIFYDKLWREVNP